MRRTLASIAWLAGCSFQITSGGGAPTDGASDGPQDGALDAPNDGPPGDGPAPVVGVPGGVTTQAIWWLTADRGVGALTDNAPVMTWMDQSAGAHHATAGSQAERPAWRAAASNFNPAIAFSNDRLVVPGGVFGTGTYPQLTLFLVLADPSTSSFDWLLHEGTNGFDRFSVSRNYNGSPGTDVDTTTTNRVTTSAALPGSLLTASWSVTASPAVTLHVDGALGPTRSSYTPFIGIGATMQLGDHANMGDAPDNPFDGRLAELYLVAAPLTIDERQRIETSLAIKHGVSLGHDYVTSTGAIVWTASGTYRTDIAGIGRDAAGNVDQRQSRSADGRALVTIGAGTIAESNAQHPTQLADGAFLVWGHDGANAGTWQTSERPAEVARRIAREWRIVETGTIGAVRVRVPDNSASDPQRLPSEGGVGIALLVDTDADFSSGASVVPMTLVGSYWEADVDLDGTRYLTFADR